MTNRRQLLLGGAGLAGLSAVGWATGLPEGTLATERLEALPGKAPLLKRSVRPPNYETPLEALGSALTPNDRFFVRWHLARIPRADPAGWRLQVGGAAAERSIELTLDELRHDFPAAEVVAVCQCAGAQRGLAQPHVPGVQWSHGAVGCARWRGARLKDVLARVNPRKDALEVACNGGDGPVLEGTPDFVKSIPMWKALEESTLLAWEMNGAALPHWNGFPVRLVVPGWAGTYWVKQLTSLELRAEAFTGFWMKTAYRMPRSRYPVVERFVSQEAESTVPVTDVDVNALIVTPGPGTRVAQGGPLIVRGVAWDSGSGIQSVELSEDEGRSWRRAELGESLGPYAFRTWQYALLPRERGTLTLLARASSVRGLSQPETWSANPAGYHNNVPQRLVLEVA